MSLWSATPLGCSMRRWDSVGSVDTQVQQDHTFIYLQILGQNSCLSPSCTTHGLESPDTTFRVRWDLAAGKVPTAGAPGDEAELPALVGISEATWHCTWKTLEFSPFYFVIEVSGQKHTLCFFHVRPDSTFLLWTSSFRCAQTSSVLQRTGHGLVCCRPVICSAYLHNLRDW